MARVIGLVGLRGAGKTLVANHLAEHHGFIVVGFKDTLVRMLASMGLTPGELDGALKEEPCGILCGKTPRHAMQTLGSEWGRQMIGVKAWARLASPHQNVVADDVRFPNEVKAVKDLGGEVWKIDRPGLTSNGHDTERPDALVTDLVIPNEGDIFDLLAEVNKFIANRATFK